MQVRSLWPHVSPPCHESKVVTQLRCDDSLSRSDALKRHQRNGGCRPPRGAATSSNGSPTSSTSSEVSALPLGEQPAAGTSSSATPPLGTDDFVDVTLQSRVNPAITALQMNTPMNCSTALDFRFMTPNPQLFNHPVAGDSLTPHEDGWPNSEFAMPQENPAVWFPNPVQSDYRRFGQSSMPIPTRHDNYFLPQTGMATVPFEFRFPVPSRHDATTNLPAHEVYRITPRSAYSSYPHDPTPIQPVYANGQGIVHPYEYSYQTGQQFSPDGYPSLSANHSSPLPPVSFGNPLGPGHSLAYFDPPAVPQLSQPYRGH